MDRYYSRIQGRKTCYGNFGPGLTNCLLRKKIDLPLRNAVAQMYEPPQYMSTKSAKPPSTFDILYLKDDYAQGQAQSFRTVAIM